MDFKKLFVTFLLTIVAVIANALDLPIKEIDGKSYYYYEVQSKETLYSLSHKLEISQEEIIKYNPTVVDGLKAHTTLYFPVDISDANNNVMTVIHKVKKGETIYGLSKKYDISVDKLVEFNPSAREGIKVGDVLIIPQQTATTQLTAETNGMEGNTATDNSSSVVDNKSPKDNTTLNIAIMLPFMLGEESPSKSALLYTDFYKGFLFAADTLSKRGKPICIYAYDTSNSLDSVKDILSRPEMKKMHLIVAPDVDTQLEDIISFGKDNDSYIFNIFSIKNETYKNNDYVLQANIPTEMMYEKAIVGMIRYFGDYTPIFLVNETGNKDKVNFTDLLKKRYELEGIPYRDIKIQDFLKSSDLSELNVDSNYIFIPQSSSLSEFNKIAAALKSVKKTTENLNHIKLFGYPEWTLFRGETLKSMHTINTIIYTRFYDDSDSFQRNNIANLFSRWYGTPMIETAPMQGLLGYDVGCYLIRALRGNDGDFGTNNLKFDGLQCSFDFTNADGTVGNVNNSVYFINFLPEGTTKKINL